MPRFAKILHKLSEAGYVRKSDFTETCFRELESMFNTNVLGIQKKGSGQRVVILDREIFERNVLKRYPVGLKKAINGANTRNEAIRIYRDSKKSYKRTKETVVIKLGSPVCAGRVSLNGKNLPIAQWCDLAGLAALRLDDGVKIEIEGTVAFIENIDVFYDFEKISSKHSYLFYTGGRISERLLQSLSISGQVTHFGDYDPVGCDEYLRIKKKFPNTVLYSPMNLERLFDEYSKKKLISKSRAILQRLRSCEDPQVQRIVELMNKYNGGLEHEILLDDRVGEQ